MNYLKLQINAFFLNSYLLLQFIYGTGHAARAVLQCLLLAIFYEMAIPTIYKLQTLIV